jgi:hypothetical protein
MRENIFLNTALQELVQEIVLKERSQYSRSVLSQAILLVIISQQMN